MQNDFNESRRVWFLSMMKQHGLENIRNKDFQFWQQHNHPIELNTNEMLEQRLDYIHNNPVEAGFVEEAHYWLHSSARDYCEAGKGKIELLFIE